MKVGIALPTYNEKENLPAMIEALDAVRAQVSWEMYVCVVDDGSPDGTGEIAGALAETRPWMEVVHRTGKQGVATAYYVAFARFLEAGLDRMVHMDADFSHHPQYLDPLVQASLEYDIVLGSRYVEGGGVSGWSRRRWWLSRAGNVFARLLLGVPFKDYTAGFKIYRREVVIALLQQDFPLSGPAFQMESIYWTWKQGFRIGEIPIIFYERRAGSSKLDQNTFLEALRTVLQLRFSYHV